MRLCTRGAFFALFSLLFLCSTNPTEVTGGGGHEVDCAAKGRVIDSCGNPKANAVVRIRSTEYIPSDMPHTQDDTLFALDLHTDIEGVFAARVPVGEYILEACDSASFGAVVAFHIDSSDTPYYIGDVTLRETRTLSAAAPAYEMYEESLFVAVPGLERLAVSTPSGAFRIENLPLGTYTLLMGFPGAYTPVRAEGINLEKLSDNSEREADSGLLSPDSLTVHHILREIERTDLINASIGWRDDGGRLTALDMKQLHLSSVPELVRNLRNLEEVSLKWNCLVSLPSWVGSLPRLRYLDVSFNLISSFPDELSRCSALIHLNCRGNRLSEMPVSVSELPVLELLDLSGNPLGSLPSSLAKVKSLKVLMADNCELEVLPDELGTLMNLSHLALENNRLSTLPNTVGRLKKLSELHLSHNRLTALPEEIGDADELAGLRVYNNELSLLPSSILKLDKLVPMFVNIRKNRLHELPGDLASWADTYDPGWRTNQK